MSPLQLPLPRSRRSIGMLSVLLLLSAALLIGSTVAAGAAPDDTWVVEASDDDELGGWRLYSRSVPGSKHLRYRLESMVDAPVERVMRAALRKIQDDQYLQDGQTRKVVRRGESEMINYLYIDAPIISDRDAVLRTSWSHDAESGAHRVDWQPSAEGPPPADGVVRIESRGFWEFQPQGSGRTRLVYEQHSEIGDSIPRWLIERLMNKQIVDELRILRQIIDTDLPAVATAGDSAADLGQ